MSTDLTNSSISENQFNLNNSHEVQGITAIELKPAEMDSEIKDAPISCNESNELNSSDRNVITKSDDNNENKSPLQSEQNDPEESSELKNDSSSFSTAFAISFEDDTKKKLTIRDSIRKFAPPKPHTIEKQRQPKVDQSQENSLMSIESAPGGLSKHSTPRVNSACSRSSGRKSNNSSRHSNVSDSAAFLIERMLNYKSAGGDIITDSQTSGCLIEKGKKSPSSQENQKKQSAHSSDGILGNEVEICEEKSDNGTYIVGTDPESDAARKKIDELFGVVRAAEASVLADSALRNQKAAENNVTCNNRQSRITDKKSFNRERQEHINRLACRNSSRSSSSSRRENSQVVSSNADQKLKTSGNHSRNSSCDRTHRSDHNTKPRRAASQSSRHSSNKDVSDCDTRSSRSSLHNEGLDVVNLGDNCGPNYSSMKYNRAFALRRARLGLGEPTTRIPHNQVLVQDSEQVNSRINSSQKRHQINTNTYRANQNQSSGSASFCREDGGRFSLRSKQLSNFVSSRLNSANNTSSNRSPQHSAALEGYLSRVAESKISLTSMNCASNESAQNRNILSKQSSSQLGYSNTGSHCQSGDEQEAVSSPSRYKTKQTEIAGRNKGGLMEMDVELDTYNNRFNYPSSQDQVFVPNYNESRASTSAGRRENNLQIGALDTLLISATSSLSKKICQSVCDVLVEHAKKLPVENETRLIVEEILPQLTSNSSIPKSPTSIEEINQSLSVDLTKTLKNLKKVEQMVEVIALISNQLPPSCSNSNDRNSNPYECNNKSDLN